MVPRMDEWVFLSSHSSGWFDMLPWLGQGAFQLVTPFSKITKCLNYWESWAIQRHSYCKSLTYLRRSSIEKANMQILNRKNTPEGISVGGCFFHYHSFLDIISRYPQLSYSNNFRFWGFTYRPIKIFLVNQLLITQIFNVNFNPKFCNRKNSIFFK